LLEAFPRLAAEERCTVATNLLKRWVTDENAASDWRTWNWSRARARTLVRERVNDLHSACPAATKEPPHDH
jgi:hypothetical protein